MEIFTATKIEAFDSGQTADHSKVAYLLGRIKICLRDHGKGNDRYRKDLKKTTGDTFNYPNF